MKKNQNLQAELASANMTIEGLLGRQTTILSSLGLPADAENREIVAKLVELSDYGLAGKQVCEKLAATLDLPEAASVDVIVATVKGMCVLLEDYRAPKMEEPQPDDMAEVRAALNLGSAATQEMALHAIEKLKAAASVDSSALQRDRDDTYDDLRATRRKLARLAGLAAAIGALAGDFNDEL